VDDVVDFHIMGPMGQNKSYVTFGRVCQMAAASVCGRAYRTGAKFAIPGCLVTFVSLLLGYYHFTSVVPEVVFLDNSKIHMRFMLEATTPQPGCPSCRLPEVFTKANVEYSSTEIKAEVKFE